MKKSLGRFIFLSKVISFVFTAGFFLFCFHIIPAKAELSEAMIYYLSTGNTAPTIRGIVDDPVGTSITVTVDRGSYFSNPYDDVTFDGNTWSVPMTGATLTAGDYNINIEATQGGITLNRSLFNGLQIVAGDYPFNFYLVGDGSDFESIIFYFDGPLEFDGFSIDFPNGIVITRTGGGSFHFEDWIIENLDPLSADLLRVIRFGIPYMDLSFSKPVTISIDVGSNYNGQTLHIFTRPDNNDGPGDNISWETLGTCLVSDGTCVFSINHASFFGISEMDNLGDESEKSHIDSWKAYQYEDANKSCSSRLKLTIKGKHFDKDAKVKIGNHEASSVDKKSSKEIVAKFCMDKLSKNEAGKKKVISVTNPDADMEEADKKIDLANIGYNLSVDDFDTQTDEGVKNIQTALAKLGLLDEKYITGSYGSITTEAVRKFQQQNGLPQTGFVGPLTKAKLQEKIK